MTFKAHNQTVIQFLEELSGSNSFIHFYAFFRHACPHMSEYKEMKCNVKPP